MDIHYSKMLKWFHHNAPEHMDRFVESVSENQLKSKQALCESIRHYGFEQQLFHDGNKGMTVEIVGGWFGFPLIELLDKTLPGRIKKMNVYDMDPFACRTVERYSAFYRANFPIQTFEMDYFEHKDERRAHMIVNTSCEHMPDMLSAKDSYVFPERTVLALQSNDMTWQEDHTNCVEDSLELALQAGLHDCIHTETKLRANRKPYTRFTVVGRWN